MIDANGNNSDFKYSSFQLSIEVLENYTKSAIYSKESNKNYKDSYNHSIGIVDSVISCIVSQNFSFSKDNKRLFKVLYKMLRDYAHDEGRYSDEARTAMRVLCQYCGFPADSIVLTDRAPMGRMARFKQKLNKWFGGKERHDDQEDKIDKMFDDVAQQKEQVKPDVSVEKNEKTDVENHVEPKVKEDTPEIQQQQKKIIFSVKDEEEPVAQEHEKVAEKTQKEPENSHANGTKTSLKKHKKIKWKKIAKIGAAITAFVGLGMAMMFVKGDSGDKKMSVADNNNEPNFKNINMTQTNHYNDVATYNIFDGLKKQQSDLISKLQFNMPAYDKFTKEIKSEQTTKDQERAVALTRASRSALDILIGAERAQKLYDKIQAKVDAGIFKLPDGMSVERVAHAMEMSRIYEGHSVILDALNSNVKLTIEQQSAFDNHIESIGDLGVKLQKRMASQHKLNNHSRYNKAKKSLQLEHVKNLKQLKQLKKHSR